MNTMVLSILRNTKILALMNASGSIDIPDLGERRALSRTGPHEQMCFYGSPGESPPGVKARTSAFLQGTLFRSRGHQCGMLINVCCGYQAIKKIYNNPWNVSKKLHHPKSSGAQFNPKGTLFHSNLPNKVMNVVWSELCWSSSKCQNPDCRSTTENTLLAANPAARSHPCQEFTKGFTITLVNLIQNMRLCSRVQLLLTMLRKLCQNFFNGQRIVELSQLLVFLVRKETSKQHPPVRAQEEHKCTDSFLFGSDNIDEPNLIALDFPLQRNLPSDKFR